MVREANGRYVVGNGHGCFFNATFAAIRSKIPLSISCTQTAAVTRPRTNADPAMLRILTQSEPFRARYDAAKQDIPVVEVR